MAYDEGLAEVLRNELSDTEGITEKKMFGGLCFLLHGNMVCGVHAKGGMARVGKEAEAMALKIDGVSPLSFTGRPMGGMVDVADATFEDDTLRPQIVGMALAYARSLPAKVAKTKKPR